MQKSMFMLFHSNFLLNLKKIFLINKKKIELDLE
jgi:hypothetical protein